MLQWGIIIYLMLGVIMVAVTAVLEKHYVKNQEFKITDVFRMIIQFIIWPYTIIRRMNEIINKNSK